MIQYAELEGKLLKAKIELMTKSVFISSICLSVQHRITTDVPTAATDNANILYNPEFIKDLSVAELAGLIAHECWHIAYQHIARRSTRDPRIWNYAGDYVINHQLYSHHFELPKGGLYDPQYADMSTDATYEKLIQDPPPPPPGGGMMDIIGEAAGNNSGTADGPTRDSTVTDIVVRAMTQAQVAGEHEAGMIPGEITRIIDKLLNPRVPWPIVLNKFLDQRVREEYSWSRRNRRHKTYMPSLHSYGLGHLTFAIDTSGSVSHEELIAMLSEIQGIQRCYSPEKMTIIDCDSRIHNVWEIEADTDILSLEFTGCGGTRFQPVLDYVTENPTQALVYFTDLYGESHLDEVDYPILWICNSDHKPANIGETVYVEDYA